MRMEISGRGSANANNNKNNKLLKLLNNVKFKFSLKQFYGFFHCKFDVIY